jgi:hypothetical protein
MNVGLLRFNCPSKAQFEGMQVLHFGTMFSTNDHELELGHFHWNL